MYVCMYVCMHACLCMSMYVYVCMHISRVIRDILVRVASRNPVVKVIIFIRVDLWDCARTYFSGFSNWQQTDESPQVVGEANSEMHIAGARAVGNLVHFRSGLIYR